MKSCVTTTRLLVAFCTVFLLTACDSTDLIQWSPDGKRVAVLASDGLRLGDETGKLSAPVDESICALRWFPDSNRAVVKTCVLVTKWADLRKILSQREQGEIQIAARKIWRSGRISSSLAGVPAQEACVYLGSLYGQQAVKNRFKLDECSMSVVVHYLRVLNLSKNERVDKSLILWRSVADINDMRMSPKGTAVVMAVESSDTKKVDEPCDNRVMVLPVKGGPARVVAIPVNGLPDWTPDGKSLVYILKPIVDLRRIGKGRKDATEPMWVFKLQRREVADADGNLLSRFAPPETLVDLVDVTDAQAHCLPDGSVIFKAKQRAYPSVGSAKLREYLYRLKPDHNLETILGSDKLFERGLAFFQPNQDGSKIVFWEYPHSQISVLDVASGQSKDLEKESSEELKLDPQWRTRDELCYPARNPTNQKPAMMWTSYCDP
ncbi:MAG TPA: hypothetical protein V6C97_10130 [Oculatellaceae cyanobacterium]